MRHAKKTPYLLDLEKETPEELQSRIDEHPSSLIDKANKVWEDFQEQGKSQQEFMRDKSGNGNHLKMSEAMTVNEALPILSTIAKREGKNLNNAKDFKFCVDMMDKENS